MVYCFMDAVLRGDLFWGVTFGACFWAPILRGRKHVFRIIFLRSVTHRMFQIWGFPNVVLLLKEQVEVMSLRFTIHNDKPCKQTL